MNMLNVLKYYKFYNWLKIKFWWYKIIINECFFLIGKYESSESDMKVTFQWSVQWVFQKIYQGFVIRTVKVGYVMYVLQIFAFTLSVTGGGNLGQWAGGKWQLNALTVENFLLYFKSSFCEYARFGNVTLRGVRLFMRDYFLYHTCNVLFIFMLYFNIC